MDTITPRQHAAIQRLVRKMAPRQALRLAVLSLEQQAMMEVEQDPENTPSLFFELMAASSVVKNLLKTHKP